MNNIMKAKLLLLLCTLLPLVACSQSRYLSTLPTGADVNRLFIGPAMMKMAGKIDTGEEIGNQLMKEVKSIEIYNCENRKLVEGAAQAFDKVLQESKAEELVYNEDDSDVNKILMIPSADNPEAGTLIVYNLEKKSELNIVVLNGKIDMAKLATMIGKQ